MVNIVFTVFTILYEHQIVLYDVRRRDNQVLCLLLYLNNIF